MDNLSTHGENAIGLTYMGRRLPDTHMRVGVFLWCVLGAVSTMYVFSRPEGISVGLFGILHVASLAIAVIVARAVGTRNRRNWEAQAAQVREMQAVEKDRQLAEFLKSKSK